MHLNLGRLNSYRSRFLYLLTFFKPNLAWRSTTIFIFFFLVNRLVTTSNFDRVNTWMWVPILIQIFSLLLLQVDLCHTKQFAAKSNHRHRVADEFRSDHFLIEDALRESCLHLVGQQYDWNFLHTLTVECIVHEPFYRVWAGYASHSIYFKHELDQVLFALGLVWVIKFETAYWAFHGWWRTAYKLVVRTVLCRYWVLWISRILTTIHNFIDLHFLQYYFCSGKLTYL